MKMGSEFPVTYTNGVLRPDEPLPIAEGARLMVSIRNGGPTPESRRAAFEFLDRVRRENLVRLEGPRLTREQLYDRHDRG
jgi:predicted DNA-binding antitoxin AbrB/MazE fold protein